MRFEVNAYVKYFLWNEDKGAPSFSPLIFIWLGALVSQLHLLEDTIIR